MDASTNRKNDRSTVFYLIIAAALLYNLILLFASKEKAQQLAKSENERTATIPYE